MLISVGRRVIFFQLKINAAAAIAEVGIPVFAWKGETLEEVLGLHLSRVDLAPTAAVRIRSLTMGDATLLIHHGRAAEITVYFDEPTDEEFKVVNALLKKIQKEDNQRWHKIAAKVKGVSEETTTGVHRLIQMEEKGELLFPAINVNDSVTKSKFDNVYGCRHSFDRWYQAGIDVLISGKTTTICGYGDVGKGCAEAMRNERAKVMVSEIDPICALQACMAGFKVCTVEDALAEADIFVTATGNCKIITAEHMSDERSGDCL